MDGQRARGAEGRRPAVNHQDGQEVHVLLVAVEARPLRPDAGCVVWVGQREEMRQRIGEGQHATRQKCMNGSNLEGQNVRASSTVTAGKFKIIKDKQTKKKKEEKSAFFFSSEQ